MKRYQQHHESKDRTLFVAVGFSVFILAVIIRLYYIQVVSHGKYAAMAEKQHWIGKEIPAKRGEILTADGYPLATNVPAYLIYAVPHEIEKPDEVAKKLIEIVGFESKLNDEDKKDDDKVKAERDSEILKLQEKINDQNLYYVPLYTKQTEDIKKKIESENIAGLYFDKDYKRFYPEGAMASQLLGFVGKNERNEDQGYYGIEGYLNGELKGIPGRVALEKDAIGRPIPVGEYLPVSSDDGRDVVLTINRELQYMVERKLKEGVEKYGAQDGTVILMEPTSGKILAMANYPTYDPGNWTIWTKDYSDKKDEELTDEQKMIKKYGVKVYMNKAVAEVYEPGSIFKPITMSAALDRKLLDENTKIESAPFKVAEYTIRTWNNKYYGMSLPAEVLQHSDNTGMARISQLIGVEPFYDYISAYGFGQKTGLSLEDEVTSWVRARDNWLDVDLATAAFGQGISVTPIQMMQAYTAFTNHGKMVKPYIVQEIKSPKGNREYGTEYGNQIIAPETADKIVDFLVSVVEKGEFKFAVLPGYKMAGKTGTASIAVNGTYDASQTNCSFIAFSPAVNPKFLMIVKLTRPSSSTYSAETAVPLWMNIAKELFVYYGIEPNS